MTDSVDPVSRSIVLRSAHILLVRVMSARFAAWAEFHPGLKSRTVELSLEVERALRGVLERPPPLTVQITITQSDYSGLLMMQPLPGAWSSANLVPGAEFVVFSSSYRSGADEVLAEQACLRVEHAETVLPGLRIVADAESGQLDLRQALALAARHTSELDPTFAEFLWARYGPGAIGSRPDFDVLVDFAERPELAIATRQALLKGAYDFVGLHGDAMPRRAQRLALAMFRTLLMPEAADLRENLVGTYLPNLLGITSEMPPQPANAVFEGHEATRKAAESLLRQQAFDDSGPLVAWLEGR
jgi:hypothetical protein